jgi:hypothetical protein
MMRSMLDSARRGMHRFDKFGPTLVIYSKKSLDNSRFSVVDRPAASLQLLVANQGVLYAIEHLVTCKQILHTGSRPHAYRLLQAELVIWRLGKALFVYRELQASVCMLNRVYIAQVRNVLMEHQQLLYIR